MTGSEAEYNFLLREHLLAVLEANTLTFAEIVRQADGAYPTAVLQTLQLLQAEHLIVDDNNSFGLIQNRETRASNHKTPQETTRYPDSDYHDPHPADYDWRFDHETIKSLVYMLTHQGSKNSRVALFGTTSLLLPLQEVDFDPYLFNNSTFLLEELEKRSSSKNLIHHNLFDKITRDLELFDFVIADPPWYVDHYRAFILRSAEILNLNGLLFLSLFRSLTRPDAKHERWEIMNFASTAGFDILEIKGSFLGYSTPKFEENSLKSDNIELSVDWRRGDLLILKKAREIDENLITSSSSNEQMWEDFLIGQKRIKLRKLNDQSDANRFSFSHVDNGKVLRTVSRRSSLRSKIDLWTSHNEAYSVTNIQLLREVLEEIQNGSSIDSVIEESRRRRKCDEEELSRLSELLYDLLQ